MQRSMHSVWNLQFINSFSTSKIGGRIVEVVTTIRQVRGECPWGGNSECSILGSCHYILVL